MAPVAPSSMRPIYGMSIWTMQQVKEAYAFVNPDDRYALIDGIGNTYGVFGVTPLSGDDLPTFLVMATQGRQGAKKVHVADFRNEDMSVAYRKALQFVTKRVTEEVAADQE